MRVGRPVRNNNSNNSNNNFDLGGASKRPGKKNNHAFVDRTHHNVYV